MLALMTAYTRIDDARHQLFAGLVDAERPGSAMREAGVTLSKALDPGNPAHYQARAAVEYGAQALRALDSIAQTDNEASPTASRLPEMCPEPDESWRDADNPIAAWRDLALERHAILTRGEAQRGRPETMLRELIGLCAGLVAWFADHDVTPS